MTLSNQTSILRTVFCLNIDNNKFFYPLKNYERTYHSDSQLVDYSLKEEGAIKLFKGNAPVEGENINHLNQFYSEMTTMYWVWKNNIISEKVGFCHYRRVFRHVIDFLPGECQVMHISRFSHPIYHEYKSAHNYQDYDNIVCILNQFYGEGNIYSEYMLHSNIFIPFYSFIMHYEDFMGLCEFFFPVCLNMTEGMA